MRNVTQIDETCDGASKKDQCLPKENHNSFNLITAINTAEIFNKWQHYTKPMGYKLVSFCYKYNF